MVRQPPSSDRAYCSALARQDQAALCGTAVQVDLWLLIEYPRPWKPKAVEDNELDPRINAHLAALPEQVRAHSGARLRVQFIKQAASADMVQPKVLVSQGQAQQQHLWSGQLTQYSDLLNLTASDLASNQPLQMLPGAERLDEPLYLVCTNGQRDVCCARFGLPVFEQLQTHVGRRVWQTTHVGGHRYAPNLLSLPSGLLYGFVTPEDVVALTQAQDDGQISLPNLRGRSCYAPAAQASEYYLRQHLGETDMHALTLTDIGGDNSVTAAEFKLAADGVARVRVEQLEGTPVVASCDGKPKPVTEFRLTDLHINGERVV